MTPSHPGPVSSRLSFLAVLLATSGVSQLTAQTTSPLPDDPVLRLDPIVVATRRESSFLRIGSAVTRIAPNNLQLSGTLSSALGSAPGVFIASSGAPGSVSSAFLRGANSGQTLFLIDGIRISDPNTDYAVLLGGVQLAKGEVVEVLRGPQSTLYGSEAMGGVVALETPPGTGESTTAIEATTGSFQTFRGRLDSSGSTGALAYRFSAGLGRTSNERTNNDFSDRFASLRVDRQISGPLSLGGTVHYFRGKNGDPGDRFTNDPDDSSREDNGLLTLFADANPAPDFNVHATVAGQLRRYVSTRPSPGIATDVTEVRNRRTVGEVQATYDGMALQRLTMGAAGEANHDRNTGFGAIDRGQKLLSVFVQDEIAFSERLFLTLGGRRDDADTYDAVTTGRATVAWLPHIGSVSASGGILKIRSSVGNGFRAPSFLDQFGTSPYYVGNPSLLPEESWGYDVGIDYLMREGQGRVSVTYFENRFTDLIVGDFASFPFTVRNLDDARTRGLETEFEATVSRFLTFRGNYTYLDAKNRTRSERLLRRPRHSGSVELRLRFAPTVQVGITAEGVADGRDIDAATFATVAADDSLILQVSARWQISDRLAVGVRAENLTNERYEPINGYPARGAGWFTDVEWRW